MDASLALIFLYSYTQKDDELEDEYEEFLTKAHELKPEEVMISVYLAQFYFYKKRLEDSIRVYEAILEKNPDYLDGVFWLGVLYEEVGRRPDAIDMWKRALKIDDHHAPTLNSLGYVYAEEGIHLNEAEKMVKRALEKEPDNGVYLDSLGWVYFKKKEYRKAEEYLKKAVVSMQDPVIFEHLGDVYIALEKTGEALEYYQKGFLLSPESEELKEKIEKYGPKDQIPEKESN
jgi:tetratricopeptide (TPR) repeat protein